jgi:hypothetical protein
LYKNLILNKMKVSDQNYKCKICGSKLYRTDGGGKTVTLQCSSESAMFWNFNRGTKEQNISHKHFMDSITHINKEDWNKLDGDLEEKI